MKILENYSLKDLTTFGNEISSRYFVEMTSAEDYKTILDDEKFSGMTKLILGEGSNILFVNNFNGIVIKNSIRGIKEVDKNGDHVYLRFGAGENWDDIVEFCVNQGYGGIENLSLIPGLAGAAPIQNIGAYGVEIKEVFEKLTAVKLDTGESHLFTKEECNFGYRDSVFKNELKGKYIITDVTLRLSKEPDVNLSYNILKQYVDQLGLTTPTTRDVRKAVIDIRKSKLPDPAELGNAGSFFKNPVINAERLEYVLAQYPDLIFYKTDDGYKIPAGWLIEKCGLKGIRKGNVGTYPKQALVIVNYGGALGEEILAFSKMIQTEVLNKFGILLTPEVNIIEDNSEDIL